MSSQVGSAKWIVEELKRGLQPEELAVKKSWEDFFQSDLDELLKTARHMHEDQLSFDLLVYLFRISNGKNLWYSAAVLSQAVQHPIMVTGDRQSILRTLRNRLDRIKDEISTDAPTPDALRQYWMMEASYYAVNGATLNETGHKLEATQNYQIAQGIYEQLGHTQQADKYRRFSQELAQGSVAGKTTSRTIAPVRSAPSAIPIPPPENGSHSEDISFAGVEIQTQKTSPDGHRPPHPAARPLTRESAEPAQVVTVQESTPQHSPVSFSADARTTDAQSVKVESLSAPADAFRPLPDVWLEDGQVHFQTPVAASGDESRRLVEQIQQQSEILAGVQLQIQMYLDRRGILEREVKQLEKKVANLRVKADRMAKKIVKLEEPK